MDLALPTCGVLSRLGVIFWDVSHALVGTHAANVWVEPRYTPTIEVILPADRALFDKITSRLSAVGLTRKEAHGPDHALVPDIWRFASDDGVTVVDLLAAKTELQQEVIRRAQALPSGLNVATPEDIFTLGLLMNRDRDASDLVELAAVPNLDWSYIERWATVWRVGDRVAAYRGISR